MEGIRLSLRPPRLRVPPAIPTGPRIFREVEARGVRYGGPGEPPPGFVMGTNSRSEWWLYWAFAKALRDPPDPRRGPPFYGGLLWRYQSPELGGFTRALGSAVVDFVYIGAATPIIVRLQTGYFHTFASAFHQELDRRQKANLSGDADVVDVYEEDFLHDESGQAVVVIVKETLGLIRRQDPTTAGTATMPRNPVRGV